MMMRFEKKKERKNDTFNIMLYRKKIINTLCYIELKRKMILIKDKWIGIGGKFERK